jgi:hypothetical protein
MERDVLFPGLATAVGSVPHTDLRAALAMVFNNLPDCPHWPQALSDRYTEWMEFQPLEGFPGIRRAPEKHALYVDTVAGEEELAPFYEKVLAAEEGGGLEEFSISPEYAEGLHAFLQRLEQSNRKWRLVKGQLIGPFSFGYTLKDREGRAIIHHPVWSDVCMKMLALKSLWQISQLSKYSERVFFFIDEPMLSVYGSVAMLSVSREEVLSRLNQVIDPLRSAGAIVGVHCCGNTDWGVLLETNLDVLNFDAYNYGPSIGIYPKEANRFLERGGWFAAGIVPNDDRLDHEDAVSLMQKLEGWIAKMLAAGINEELLRKRVIITPSCGRGTLTIAQSEKVYALLKALQAGYKA